MIEQPFQEVADYLRVPWVPWRRSRLTSGGSTILQTALATALLLFLLPAVAHPAVPVEVTISDPTGDRWHVHDQPGFPLEIGVGTAPHDAFLYQWRDYAGRALTGWNPLPPDGRVQAPALPLSFFDLALRPGDERFTLPLRQPGEMRLYGFAVLGRRDPVHAHARHDASRLGVVHLPVDEASGPNDAPHANPYFEGWCKTLEWGESQRAPEAWQRAVQRRLDAGFKELPIAIGGPWKAVDDARPAPPEALEAIYRQARVCLEQEAACTDPTGDFQHYWELGLEESAAVVDEHRPRYLANLREKARQFRRAADDLKIGSRLRLLWQDVEWNSSRIAEKFLASDAAREFDVLAVHPYPWRSGERDYIDPEAWLPGLMDGIHAAMRIHGQPKPVWFTEVGQPVQYNYPTAEFGGSFETNAFGYPDGHGGYGKNGWPVYDNGIPREHAADYLVKVCALAFGSGVERIFWYNYRDGGRDPYFAEDNFGLFDADGFPKPSFPAFCTVAANLANRPVSGEGTTEASHPATVRRLGSTWVCDFPPATGFGHGMLVAWTEDGQPQRIAVNALRTGRESVTILRLSDGVGTVIPPPTPPELTLTGQPVFVEYEVQPPTP